MTFKVLIYGGRGWIGKQIVDLLHKMQNVETIVSETRVTSYSDVMKDLLEYNPTHVISTIGRTSGYIDGELVGNIDYLEYPTKLKENINDNLFSPLMIALATKDLGIHFTYLGTGCIFEYNEDNVLYKFDENDEPNFFGSSYSITKGYTDKIMKTCCNVLNARIRMPITYNPHTKDFITKIGKFEKVCSVPNSMTVLDDLLPILIDMTLNNVKGTINLANPGVISHNDILEMYKEYCDKEHTWTTITHQELVQLLKADRSNNHLDTKRLETLYPKVPNIMDSVKRIFQYRSIDFS